MSKYTVTPSDQRISFEENEIIVSKTDLKGRITYANHVFCRLAEMSTEELLGQPHSIIRHPDMPRCIFQLLWDTLTLKQEIFAYVKNMSKSGKYYWVLAHVTPSYNQDGHLSGYHSNRRTPNEKSLGIIQPLYQSLLEIENKHPNAKTGQEQSMATLTNMLKDKGQTYDEFIWEIGNQGK